MNSETILKLAKQAGLKFPSETALSPPEIKFAELIVQECLGVIHKEHDEGIDRHSDYQLAVYEVYREIKDHFGVEE